MVGEPPYDRQAATSETAAIYLDLIEAETSDPFKGDPRLSLENLAWLCREIISRGPELPIDKPSRWLGFIQGCLAMRGIVDVDAERSSTRPKFHRAYQTEGIELPATHAREIQEGTEFPTSTP